MTDPDDLDLPDFRDWGRLAHGSADQRRAHAVLDRHRPFDRLAGLDVGLAGTFPLDIAVAGSDLDILVHATDPIGFAARLDTAFGRETGYRCRQIHAADGAATVAAFTLDGLPVEIFAQDLPVGRQMGWRHLLVEARLLALAPPLRPEIRALKAAGMKTEPAFCHVLGLEGDAYAALLRLETQTNSDVYSLICQRRPAMCEKG